MILPATTLTSVDCDGELPTADINRPGTRLPSGGNATAIPLANPKPPPHGTTGPGRTAQLAPLERTEHAGSGEWVSIVDPGGVCVSRDAFGTSKKKINIAPAGENLREYSVKSPFGHAKMAGGGTDGCTSHRHGNMSMIC